MTAQDRLTLTRRGRRLEYFSIGWNSLEGVIALGAGAVAGSISLVGFGIDSAIEVTSGAALLWRMSGSDHCLREKRETLTLRIVGACFVALAGYVAYEAIRHLMARTVPESSIVGIALAWASLVVMPLLSRAKRRVGQAMGSAAMHADAKQADFCAYLSAILLGGLLSNVAFGMWWADPVAALVMTPIILREGIAGLRGDRCCD